MSFGKEFRAISSSDAPQPAMIETYGRPPVSCRVRDITEQRALIEIPSGIYVPKTFALRLVRGDAVIACRILELRNGLYSVAFTDYDGTNLAVKRAIRSMAQALRA